MRATVLVVLTALATAGCDPSVTYSGYNMDEYFPFDGARTWEFVSSDATLPYKLVATLNPDFSLENDVQIFEVSWEQVCVSTDDACTDQWIRTVLWSSDRTFGTRIYGFETPSGTVTYDPALQFTDGQMLVGDVETTSVGGTTWTSTFVGLERFPVLWTSEWGDRCIRVHLDDGDGDDTTGEYLAGNYWMITQYNVVGMQLTDDTGTWQLSYATFDPVD